MKLKNYEKKDFDRQPMVLNEGCYPLTILGVKNITKKMKEKGFDMSGTTVIEFEFDQTDDVEINMNLSLWLRDPNEKSKGTWFLLNDMVDAAGVEIDSDGDFDPHDFIGRKILVYIFRGKKGYYEIYNRVFPNEEKYEPILKKTFAADRYVKKWTGIAEGQSSTATFDDSLAVLEPAGTDGDDDFNVF